MTRRGITLVELVVVAVITAGIAAATTTAISQAVRARDISQSRFDAFRHADIAARAIANDIRNVVRDGDLFYTRVLLKTGGRDNAERDELLIFARSDKLARVGGDPEGTEYEIHYRAVPEFRADGTDGKPFKALELFKRTDPVPDDVPEGGGVVYPVTTNLTAVSILAFDGRGWYETWDSDDEGYPHAIAVTVTAKSPDGDRTAHARRVVAIDRTPIPYTSIAAPNEEEEEGDGS